MERDPLDFSDDPEDTPVTRAVAAVRDLQRRQDARNDKKPTARTLADVERIVAKQMAPLEKALDAEQAGLLGGSPEELAAQVKTSESAEASAVKKVAAKMLALGIDESGEDVTPVKATTYDDDDDDTMDAEEVAQWREAQREMGLDDEPDEDELEKELSFDSDDGDTEDDELL